MKKIIFTLLIFYIFSGSVEAFDIDINKLSISNKSEELIENLDSKYKIDADSYQKSILYDEEVTNLTKELIEISIKDVSIEEKSKLFTNYIYYDKSDGFQTLTSRLFIDTFVKQLDGKKIEVDYIKVIRTVECENGILAFAYLPNVKYDGVVKDIVFAYWLIKDDDGYKLHYPWMNLDENLESYFNEVAANEDNGKNIGGTYKSIDLVADKSEISDDELNSLYEQNKKSVVQITGLNHEGPNVYGSGFFIREGIVVTSWSLFLQMLNESQYLYVNDVDGNSYSIDGIVSADVDYDVAVLKITEEVGKMVSFGETGNLEIDDKIFMINSKNNSSFSINYGSFVSLKNGKLENLFALNKADVGAALFNENGEVIGFNTGEVIYSELSYANSTDYLKQLQNVLKKQEFTDIYSISFTTFKDNYYNDIQEEKTIEVDDNVWNKYSWIGNLEENISLELVKAYYEDGILSLRYKNNIANSIKTFFFISNYVEDLENQGFKQIYNSQNKIILKDDNYKIVLKNNMDYLVILIMEI